jgi:hypothetical protein
MKNFSILLAMLFLAFTVEAQNAERSKRAQDKKSTKSSVRKASGKSSKTKVTQVPSSSKTRNSRSSSVATRSSSNRNTKYSSDAPDRKSNVSRNSRGTSSSRVAKSSASRSNSTVSRSSNSSRKVRASSASRSPRSTASVVSDRSKNRNSSSVASRSNTSKIASRQAASRKVYSSNKYRVNRRAPAVRYSYPTLEYRRVHNPYRKPLLSALYWNARMYRNYRLWYPDFNLWYYPQGYRIHTISAYDSFRYVGEVARIYGRVSEVYYSSETREYYLYFGGSFPYHDFTVILNARDANRYSWDPISYFSNRRLIVTGLVSLFDQKPELFVRKRSQIRLY